MRTLGYMVKKRPRDAARERREDSMASITEASIIPPDPTFSGPLNYELVETDGVPLDSLWQQMQIGMLVNLTYTWVGDRQDYFAGGNQFIYYSKTRDRTTDFRGPDFYFVDKVPRQPIRRWWCVW